ncbi:unnamed protein product, partial [Vitis vinifera]
MGCFRCGKSDKKLKKNSNSSSHNSNNNSKPNVQTQSSPDALKVNPYLDVKKETDVEKQDSKEVNPSLDVKKEVSGNGLPDKNGSPDKNGLPDKNQARTFTFHQLAVATDNFRSDCFLGEGGFGKVFKGYLDNPSQVVAIKQLDRNGLQGIREFFVEVLTLSSVDHPNLVKLIGYCAEGDQRLLVYEYMPLGSLENHLHDLPPGTKPLDWNSRMKIAAGAAKGLEYLHDKIFGVVLLELITGRKAIDNSKGAREQNLVAWARPLFKDRRKFSQMADPLLHGQYPVRGLYQALAIAAMCVQEQPNMRPLIADVVTALNYLASQTYNPQIHPVQSHQGSISPTTRKGSDKKSSQEMHQRKTEGEK